jgi:hypothetical protein
MIPSYVLVNLMIHMEINFYGKLLNEINFYGKLLNEINFVQR